MTQEFAFRWAFVALTFFALVSIISIVNRMPLPPNAAACLAIGAFVGAIIVGPIVYASVRQS